MDLFSAVYFNFFMNFLKLISFFIFLIYCVCCWLFVAILSQIQVQVLIGGFRSAILIFVVFMPIWTSWLGLDRIMMFRFVLSLKYRSDRRHLSELRIRPLLWWPQTELRNSTPGAKGLAHHVREVFRSFRQSKLECSCHESCVSYLQ